MPGDGQQTKATALAQCAARSKGVKRSILRPVSGSCRQRAARQ